MPASGSPSFPDRLLVGGLVLFLAIVAADLAAARVWQALALAGLGGVGLGLVILVASLVAHGWLAARDFILFGLTGRRVRINRTLSGLRSMRRPSRCQSSSGSKAVLHLHQHYHHQQHPQHHHQPSAFIRW